MANDPYTSVWNIDQIQHLTWPREVHEADGYVYIGRADHGNVHMNNCSPGALGWMGNPYTVDRHGRERAIELFRDAFYTKLKEKAWFRRSVLALSGRKLVCYCKPKPCHGDVIAEYLNNAIENLDNIEAGDGDTQ